MPPVKTIAALAGLCLASCSARHSGTPQISISGAWSRATVAGQSSAAAYFSVTNKGDGDDRLLSVSAPMGKAMLHSTTITEQGVMEMRPMKDLPVPAHSTVTLKPGGMHVMIMNVKKPLQAGDSYNLQLRFDRSGTRNVTVAVRPATATGATT